MKSPTMADISMQGEFEALSEEYVSLRQRFHEIQMHPVSMSEHRRFREDATVYRGRVREFLVRLRRVGDTPSGGSPDRALRSQSSGVQSGQRTFATSPGTERAPKRGSVG